MNEIRMLDPKRTGDLEHLIEILESYKENELNQVNPVYALEYLIKFSDWIIDRFTNVNTTDFVIFGSFYNDELIQIMVAYKFETGWGDEIALNGTPYWYVGLAYFKDRAWRYPGVELINLGLCLGAHFERQGFYKFYTVKKMPERIKTYEQLKKYIDSAAFKKTYQVVRYHVDVDKIFYNNTELENYRFSTVKALLPRRISRPIMLLEFTLDPTIDISKIVSKNVDGMAIDDFIKHSQKIKSKTKWT